MPQFYYRFLRQIYVSEDMVDICRQGIVIDDDNDPAPENVHRQGETTAGTGNCRRENIISPQKYGNL